MAVVSVASAPRRVAAVVAVVAATIPAALRAVALELVTALHLLALTAQSQGWNPVVAVVAVDRVVAVDPAAVETETQQP